MKGFSLYLRWFISNLWWISSSPPDSFLNSSSHLTQTYISPFLRSEAGAPRQRITLAPIGGLSARESQIERSLFSLRQNKLKTVGCFIQWTCHFIQCHTLASWLMKEPRYSLKESLTSLTVDLFKYWWVLDLISQGYSRIIKGDLEWKKCSSYWVSSVKKTILQKRNLREKSHSKQMKSSVHLQQDHLTWQDLLK